MSRFGQGGHGPQGGQGARAGGGSPHGPGPRQGFGGPPRPQRRDRQVTDADLWGPEYLKDGYFDEAGNLRLEYVSRAKVEPLARAMANDFPKLTTAQLRRFFHHCRTIETRLKSGGSSWAGERANFVFLDAAAQDAFGKSQPKIPGLFYDFIKRNVDAVRTGKDFREGFLPHFEALVGFGSLYVERERN